MKDENEITRAVRPVDEYDHIQGAPSSPAILVQYGDYECPYCRQLHPVIREIIKRTENLRYVYRHFPISHVHPYAAKAAQAAEAASAQGRFWQMHDLLFEKEQQLNDERLALCARKAGLDLARYKREMAEGLYVEKVEKAFKTALYGEGITGTPTIYLNGERLNDIHGLEGLLDSVVGAGAIIHANDSERNKWRKLLSNLRHGVTRSGLLNKFVN